MPPGAIPIFVGTEKDAAPIEELRKDLPEKGISLAGKTTIAELAALLAQCDLIVSLDTGTFHVARAVGLPGVVIAPAWQSPLEWLPVQSERYRVLRGPSIRDIPPDYSIDEISVEQVCDAAQSLLEKYPADPAQRASRVERSRFAKDPVNHSATIPLCDSKRVALQVSFRMLEKLDETLFTF